MLPLSGQIFASVINAFPRPYRYGQKEYLRQLALNFAEANQYTVTERFDLMLACNLERGN